MTNLCTEPETTFFPSRQSSERLEGKNLVVLDVEEATGRPRLVAALHVAPESRIGLFVSNNPINMVDPLGLCPKCPKDAANAVKDMPRPMLQEMAKNNDVLGRAAREMLRKTDALEKYAEKTSHDLAKKCSEAAKEWEKTKAAQNRFLHVKNWKHSGRSHGGRLKRAKTLQKRSSKSGFSELMMFSMQWTAFKSCEILDFSQNWK